MADPPRLRALRTGALLLLGALLPAAALAAGPGRPLRVLEQSVDYPGSEGDMPAHLYAGADHLFNFALGAEAAAAYRSEADRLSWERTLGFLARHLDPAH